MPFLFLRSSWAALLFALVLAASPAAAAGEAAGIAEQARPPLERATLRIDQGAHTAAATSIAVSSDGAFIVTGSEDRTVRLWDARSGELLRTLRPPSIADGEEGQIFAVAVSPVLGAGGSRLVAVGGYTSIWDDRDQHTSSVYLFDASSGALVRRLPGPEHTATQRYSVDRIAFSPDGRRLVAIRSQDHLFSIYDVATGAPLDRGESAPSRLLDADFDPSGRLLISRAVGGVRLYEREIGSSPDRKLQLLLELIQLDRLARARFSPDGKRVALLYASGRVEVRGAQDFKQPQPIAPAGASGVFAGGAVGIAWSADGRQLILAGQFDVRKGSAVRTYTVDSAPQKPPPSPPSPPSPQSPLPPPIERPLPVAAVRDFALLPSGAVAFAAADGSWGTLSPDGTAATHAGSRTLAAEPEALRVDSTGSEIEIHIGPNPKNRLRFSLQALELHRGAAPENPSLRPPDFDVPTPHHISGWHHKPPVLLDDGTIVTRGEDPAAMAMAPGREAFVIGASAHLFGYRFEQTAADGCPYKPRETSELKQPCFATPLTSAAVSVNYSGDGRHVVALHADGTVRWYGARDGRERLALVLHPDDGRWLLFRPDGLFAASPGGAELAGWQLNRPQEQAADFFPLSRFQRSHQRPEQVVATLSEPAATVPSLKRELLPPLVTILEPADGAQLSETRVVLKVAVRLPEPMGPGPLPPPALPTLRVRVDGRPIATGDQRGVIDLGASEPAATPLPASDAGSPSERIQTLTVPVPPRDSTVAVYAESANGAGPAALLRLHWRGSGGAASPAAAQAPRPTLHVLAIGVGDYLRPELRLRYPAKDARDLAALLGQKQAAKGLYENVDLRVLTDREATRTAILDSLDWLHRRAGAGDTTLLFLAGHGVNDPTTGDYYFLPADAEPGSALRSMLPASTLQQVLATLPGRVVLLLDTCHSGNVLGTPGRQQRGLPPLNRAVSELASVESGVVVMTAATGGQASVEDAAWQNGAFTKALLEGLSGSADQRHTGRVTVNMLDLYISERVRELTAGSQTPATAKPSTIADFPLLLTAPPR